jgi:hypothetical protein
MRSARWTWPNVIRRKIVPPQKYANRERITGHGLTAAAEFIIYCLNSFRGGGIKPEIIPFEPDLDHASVGKRIRVHRPPATSKPFPVGNGFYYFVSIQKWRIAVQAKAAAISQLQA